MTGVDSSHEPRDPESERPEEDRERALIRAAREQVAGAMLPPPPLSRIGPYHILRELGEGGMGVVYLAQQEEPVRRRVALKLIRPGMDSRSFLKRFDNERRTLALMSHPSIASVLDAGTAPDGRPYCVMELVRGLPVSEYCDGRRLDVRRRIELVIEICRAVQHAHQKGVIHRDLKPSNILVRDSEDGEGMPIPKIIDFGLARAADPRLTDEGLTRHGLVVGTLEYMSPEQADPSHVDVDTRTDIWSLGVVLHEILTGRLPFERRGTASEFSKRLREEEAPRPSSRVLDSDTEPARRRSSVPGSLRRALRGDLDWIVLRCLEKNPAQRYASASDLAADLERHLRDEPVLAGPPSILYRASKLWRRRRLVIVATALVSISAVGGIFWRTQADRAHRRLADEIGSTDEVAGFLLWILASLESQDHDQREVGVQDIIDNAAREIDRRFSKRPEVKATVLVTLGEGFQKLGWYEVAESFFRDAATLSVTLHGATQAATHKALGGLAEASLSLGRTSAAADALERIRDTCPQGEGEARGRYLRASTQLSLVLLLEDELERAEMMCRETHEEQLRTLGPLARDTFRTRRLLSRILWERGQREEAEQICQEIFDHLQEALGEEHEDTLESAHDLVRIQRHTDRRDAAVALCEHVLAVRTRDLGPRHPDTVDVQVTLASLRYAQRRFAEAEGLCRSALAVLEKKLGASHPTTLETRRWLALSLFELERHDEAIALCRATLDIHRERFGDERPDTLRALQNLAVMVQKTGDTERAEGLCREALEKRRRIRGEDHPVTIRSLMELAQILGSSPGEARQTEALALARRAHAAARRVLGAQHPDTLQAAFILGNVLLARNDLGPEEKAELASLLRAVHEGRCRTIGEDHPDTLDAANNLAVFLTQEGRNDEAKELLEKIVAASETVLPESYRSAYYRWSYAECLIALGSLEAAEYQLSTAHAFFRDHPSYGSRHPWTRGTGQALADLRRQINTRPAGIR